MTKLEAQPKSDIRSENIKKLYPKDLGKPNLKSFKWLTFMAIKENVGLFHVQTSVMSNNVNRIIFTEISGQGKKGNLVFQKVHDVVENTQSGAIDQVFTENEILRRKLTNEKYVEEIQKYLPEIKVVGAITNTLKRWNKEKVKSELQELFDSAERNGIKAYDINA